VPEGSVDDAGAQLPITALAARKQYFSDQVIAQDGVAAYPYAVGLLRRLRRNQALTAVVASRRNGVEGL
jgi:hypothetical protein